MSLEVASKPISVGDCLKQMNNAELKTITQGVKAA